MDNITHKMLIEVILPVKEHFLKNVPIRNLELLLHTAGLPIEIPALTDAWIRLVRPSYLRQFRDTPYCLTQCTDISACKQNPELSGQIGIE